MLKFRNNDYIIFNAIARSSVLSLVFMLFMVVIKGFKAGLITDWLWSGFCFLTVIAMPNIFLLMVYANNKKSFWLSLATNLLLAASFISAILDVFFPGYYWLAVVIGLGCLYAISCFFLHRELKPRIRSAKEVRDLMIRDYLILLPLGVNMLVYILTSFFSDNRGRIYLIVLFALAAVAMIFTNKPILKKLYGDSWHKVKAVYIVVALAYCISVILIMSIELNRNAVFIIFGVHFGINLSLSLFYNNKRVTALLRDKEKASGQASV